MHLLNFAQRVSSKSRNRITVYTLPFLIDNINFGKY